jgi:excinuclease ABC subunit C
MSKTPLEDGGRSLHIAEKLKYVPDRPGVYLMRNDAGDVIYVGKAVSLRHRVRSYFQESRDAGPKVEAMVRHVADFGYIVTDSEIEALILEANLIKEEEPWYNIRLKDDKSYPYLKITEEPFPRVLVVRRPDRQDRVFGPYTDSRAVRQTLQFLRKLFPLRTCNIDLSGERKHRPCLLYHIGRCGAPCAGLQSEKEYAELITEVELFLEGRHDRLLPSLEKKMNEAAARLEFERAARLRDQIQAMEKVIERQKIVTSANVDQDVLGLALADALACVQVFFVRGGKVVGSEHFFLDVGEEEDQSEILRSFVQQYYNQTRFVPQEVLLPLVIESGDVVEAWLSRKRGGRVHLRRPQRGEKRRLVEMVSENARLVLAERQERASARQRHNEAGLRQLKEVLRLVDQPQRIEAYDVSNFQGSDTVASMVVLQDGEPVPADYRRFRIRGVQGPDDFAAMREVVQRRFQRALREQRELAELEPAVREDARAKAKFAHLPDLVLIDGGRGQLNAAVSVLRELGLGDLPAVGLAERLEEIYMQGQSDPLRLREDSPGIHLLQRARDEAHRFALGYHRQLRDRRTQASSLDAIEGVGPARKRALIKHFGSVKGVREASLAELQAVPGLPQVVAQRIYEQLGRNERLRPGP